jgi:excisionase family DNA binding protein
MTPDDLRGRNFLIPREAGEFLGGDEPVDERTVRRAIELGQIPAVKIGTKTLIPAAALLAMAEAPESLEHDAPPTPAVDAVSAAREILLGALRALDALAGYHARDHEPLADGSAAGRDVGAGGLDVLPLRSRDAS